jgi:uncharacterized protein
VSRALSVSIFVVVSLAVLGGMHTYLWLRLVRDTAMAELVALRAAPRPLARIVPAVAFGWLGLAFMLFCALVAVDVVRVALHGSELLADWLRRRPDPPADPARRLFVARALAGGAALATGGAAALAFRAATGPAEISEVAVRLERLPPALSGLTIAQLSDLHVGPTIGERDVRRAVDQTNALRPDVIAITGDLVDGSVRDLGRAISHLARLRARYGVYFVTGNHEYYSGVEEWLEELPRLGVRVLRNERVTVGDAGASIDLAGVDDWSAARMNGGHESDLRSALAGRDPERGLVLLAHQPRGIAEAVQAGVELQLSGHTHGGQIVPFNLVVAAAQPYVKGLHRHVEGDRAGQIFVSRGTGYWGPPLRLGSPPEIARIVLTT